MTMDLYRSDKPGVHLQDMTMDLYKSDETGVHVQESRTLHELPSQERASETPLWTTGKYIKLGDGEAMRD